MGGSLGIWAKPVPNFFDIHEPNSVGTSEEKLLLGEARVVRGSLKISFNQGQISTGSF